MTCFEAGIRTLGIALTMGFVLVLGCASSVPGRLRFFNRPIVWQVDDRRDVPVAPKARPFDHKAYVAEHVIHRPVADLLAVPAPMHALDVNALDEVPDSTWFQNRIGRWPLSADDVRRGPNTSDGPSEAGPWRVKSMKPTGGSAGFLIEDARGEAWLLKLEHAGHPEAETGADVVVQRLMWAAGYHVAEDSVVYFSRDRLVVAEGASWKDPPHEERRLTDRDLDETLAKVDGPHDGRYRGLASKLLAGKPLGGYPQEGVRADDSNDTIAHEHRRSLRGQYVFFGWVGHGDAKEDNFLDMWVPDPGRPASHHVMHYIVDFGIALGVSARISGEQYDGYGWNFDYRYVIPSVFTLGLWRRPWEYDVPWIRGVGRIDAEHFDPGAFATRNRFIPFQWVDFSDGFWAAKIVMRFRPEHIRAAVEAGRYSDPRAVEYLVAVLLQRQRKIGEYWFSRGALDGFDVVERGQAPMLCAVDLRILHGLAEPSTRFRYRAQSYDWGGRMLGSPQVVWTTETGRVCVSDLRLGKKRDEYTIVVLTSTDARGKDRSVRVHVARDPTTGGLRIIGVRRT